MAGAGIGWWAADTVLTEGGAALLLLTRSGGGFAPLLRVVDSSFVAALATRGTVAQRIRPQRRLLLVLSDGREFVIAALSLSATRRLRGTFLQGVPSGFVIQVLGWYTEQRQEQVVVHLSQFVIIRVSMLGLAI
eukprot:2526527-Heterocapsa_arctica.AAC.1